MGLTRKKSGKEGDGDLESSVVLDSTRSNLEMIDVGVPTWTFKGMSCLEIPDGSVGASQPGDPDMKVLEYDPICTNLNAQINAPSEGERSFPDLCSGEA